MWFPLEISSLMIDKHGPFHPKDFAYRQKLELYNVPVICSSSLSKLLLELQCRSDISELCIRVLYASILRTRVCTHVYVPLYMSLSFLYEALLVEQKTSKTKFAYC